MGSEPLADEPASYMNEAPKTKQRAQMENLTCPLVSLIQTVKLLFLKVCRGQRTLKHTHTQRASERESDSQRAAHVLSIDFKIEYYLLCLCLAWSGEGWRSRTKTQHGIDPGSVEDMI